MTIPVRISSLSISTALPEYDPLSYAGLGMEGAVRNVDTVLHM